MNLQNGSSKAIKLTRRLSKLMKRIDERETRSQWFKQKNPLYKGIFVASFAAVCVLVLLPHSSLTISDLIRNSDALHLFKYGLKPMPAEGIRVSSHLGAVMIKETGYGFRAELEGP